MATAKKATPRIFLYAKFADATCDSIVTSQEITTTGGTQIYTVKDSGGVTLETDRPVSELGFEQVGVTDIFLDGDTATLKMTIGAANNTGGTAIEDLTLAQIAQLTGIDPNFTGTDTAMWGRSNEGAEISGFSLIIYDKQVDATNNTNVPDVTADGKMWVIFNATPVKVSTLKKDGKQVGYELELRCLVSTSTGSASGVSYGIGAFTAAA